MAVDAWFGSRLLSALDAQGRADALRVGIVHRLAPGTTTFRAGDAADALWFVGSGSVRLDGPRGAEHCGPRAHFGTEALVRGALRVTNATAERESVLLELPVSALRRIVARSGVEGPLVRAEAAARRQAFALLVAESPLGRALDNATLAVVVRELHEERRAAGEALFRAGEKARCAYFVTGGLVALDRAGTPSYAARGDWLALGAVLARATYTETALAQGELLALGLPERALLELAQRYPHAVSEQQSVTQARQAKQVRVQGLAGERATRHAFSELERLASARSLLAIDLESCVRCGHCVRACADAYGTPRLERRGERVRLTLVGGEADVRTRALLLPRSCQHCADPACLVECPTGAIVRDANGTVHVREAACTGCGACAKACPWDAIRMAPRTPSGSAVAPSGVGAPSGAVGAAFVPTVASAAVAAKCDACRPGIPECTSVCPTGAIGRIDPARDVLELKSVSEAQGRRVSPGGTARTPRWLLYGAALPPLVAWVRLAQLERFRMATGVFAGACCVLLALHAAVKRVRSVRAYFAPASKAVASWRGLAPLRHVHELLGVGACGAVVLHGARGAGGAAGMAWLLFWLLATSGGALAVVYRLVPRRLARLERRGTLPEDHAAERAELEQRLFFELSATDVVRKELVRRLLAPYAYSASGAFALLVAGRALAEERAVLATRVEAALGGRPTTAETAQSGSKREIFDTTPKLAWVHRDKKQPADRSEETLDPSGLRCSSSKRLGDVSGLVETAVALRALGARRLLEGVLAVCLPAHVVLSVLFFTLVVVHVVGVLR